MVTGKKYDWLLYSILAASFALSCALVFATRPKDGGLTFEAVRGGTVIERRRAAELTDGVALDLSSGAMTNIVASDPTGIRMVLANCPGGDCLRARPMKNAGDMIVCIPHKLIMRIVSSSVGAIDVMSY
ncbi:MAG: NusG domain II-containing protein [Synergistaceae bacterium]|jgi:hypothetical protein|nr:NusG domain II-containing protein [Synergistaceae bacterium]